MNTISKEELRALERVYKSRSPFLFRRKCHCILESNKGKSMEELSVFFEVRRATIGEWFDRWELEGIEGLKIRAGRGRPKKLDEADEKQVEYIKELVENNPQNLTVVVAQVQEEYGLESLSKKTLQRFLKKLTINGNVSAKF